MTLEDWGHQTVGEVQILTVVTGAYADAFGHTRPGQQQSRYCPHRLIDKDPQQTTKPAE